jgi:hypothetical protein
MGSSRINDRLSKAQNTCLKCKIYLVRRDSKFLSRSSMNRKKLEIAVKQIVCGIVRAQVSGTVENPESLEECRQFIEVEKVHHERTKGARLWSTIIMNLQYHSTVDFQVVLRSHL